MRTVDEIVAHLKSLADPERRKGMSRVGIDAESALGLRIPQLRAVAKQLGTNHGLALDLWDTGIHEVRILASMVADSAQVDEALVESWAAGMKSWDLCDQCCNNLFRKTSFAWALATAWPHREPEFERRIGFVTAACLAVHDKARDDHEFLYILELCEQYAHDGRNMVKKGVNWALRQVGKRSLYLHPRAIEVAERILDQGTKPARWVATDALRELKSPKLRIRMS